ncbi:TPA: CmlA/FloR family chloramphenicol efflux MFS transporter [Pseudomonas aeruginosa]|uniref:CmlA/FloR family chloramphenicol efflux MFS transporter n=1 Tax=Pseudomonas aeruginosa TaxID=287 RepID=UPI000E310AB3|nr:CmlA/FloR family chloramphenicol efflux MFS transporter [Pseudomonas aeruginosa]NPX94486.1 CmlA/FloR family chloramphenicol efflux MFS transporter [Pseudomonas aeruginosa]
MSNQFPKNWAYSLPSAIALMAPFDLLAALAMDIYLPVIPTMPAELGTSPGIIQLTLSVYMLVLGLGQMIFGPLSDRVGRRPVLLGGALLFSAASLALAMTQSGVPFVILRTLQALGASAALVATFATVRDVYADSPESSTIYGLFSSMLAAVPALGPIVGSAIALAFDWRAIFFILSLLGLIAFVRALPRWHETRPERRDVHQPAVARILTSGEFWVYTLGFSAAMGAFFVFFSTAPRVLVGRAGLSQFEFSMAFSTVAIAMIVASRLTKSLVSRWGVPGCLSRGLLVMMAGALIQAINAMLFLPSVIAFVLPMWLVAVGIVIVASVTANGALRDFAEVSGTAVALYYCIQSLIVGGVGTILTFVLPGDTAWPLVAYCFGLPAISLMAQSTLRSKCRKQG